MEKFTKPKVFILKTVVDKNAKFPEIIIAIGKGETEVSGEYIDNWTWYYDVQNVQYPCIFVDNLYTQKID